MAKQNWKATKPCCKRPKKHVSKQEAKMNLPQTDDIPIWKSNRIIKYPLDGLKLCAEVTTVAQDDNEKRPIRQQTIELPIELKCAHISRETVNRLKIKSCSNCDNFYLDRPFMRSESTQDTVCKQRYGCTREKAIQVSVKFLHHNYASTENTFHMAKNINKKKDTEKISVTKVNRKYGQWRWYDQANKLTKK